MKQLIRFDFGSQKGQAFLEFLLDNSGGQYNYIGLLKLAFFADRYHIRNYGRPVAGDFYFAMRHGAVPSNLKDILENEFFYGENIHKDSNYIVSLKSSKDIDKQEFSKSDIEAIEFAIENFSNIGKDDVWKLTYLCHAYPEWDKYKDQFEGDKKNNRYSMDFFDFLKNAIPNHSEFKRLNFTDPYIPLTDSDRSDLMEEMEEMDQLYGEENS